MHKYFILVPRMIPSGPIKGAVALANELVDSRPVTLVSLKNGNESGFFLDSRVKVICLKNKKTFRARLAAYRALLREAGGRKSAISLSFCFSADGLNLFCRKDAITGSSVRGNLILNYTMDYGVAGFGLAIAHMIGLRRFDHIFAMTKTMALQLKPYCGRMPHIVGNFVDERRLEPYRVSEEKKGSLRFVFVASLSKRKQPLSLLKAAIALHGLGHDIKLDIIGEGELRSSCAKIINDHQLADCVTLCGQLQDPYPLIAQADVMVLPSLSEGVSRAMMEALFLGVPCVARRVDSNHELIFEGVNGQLFSNECDLPKAMLTTATESRARTNAGLSLLPNNFRQTIATQRLIELMERE